MKTPISASHVAVLMALAEERDPLAVHELGDSLREMFPEGSMADTALSARLRELARDYGYVQGQIREGTRYKEWVITLEGRESLRQKPQEASQGPQEGPDTQEAPKASPEATQEAGKALFLPLRSK